MIVVSFPSKRERESAVHCANVMDTDVTEANGCKNKIVSAIDSQKVDIRPNNHVDGEDNESNTLLPPRRGGMSRRSEKTRLKVQWNDKNGNKLAEVLEFQPSDVSDSDDEDSDSCICSIM